MTVYFIYLAVAKVVRTSLSDLSQSLFIDRIVLDEDLLG